MSHQNSLPIQSPKFFRALIYTSLIAFALIYLLPMFVMIITSLKTLDEIRQGNILSLPSAINFDAWRTAWDTACIGVTCQGIKVFVFNSIKMVVPAVVIATLLGAINGYVLTKWKFRGHKLIFGLMLFGCFIPFQSILLPMAQVLGNLGLASSTAGLILVHVTYGIGFSSLFFRNYYEAFPDELIKSAQIDGASFFRIFTRLLLPNSAPIIIVTVIWLFTNIWNDFLFGASFSAGDSAPVTVALNNLVNTSTGVKEYNVHMAAAFISAFPTLLVYIFAGRYFVRGLMSGSVKG